VTFTAKRLPSKTPGQTVNVDDPCYGQGTVACFDTSPDANTRGIPLTVNVSVTQEGDYISATAPTGLFRPR
jgi:hypothetical protein